MKLNNPLVTSFRYNDKEYDIDLAFDNVLDAFDVLKDRALRDNEKAEIALMLLLDKEVGEDTVELWNYVYDTFINCQDNTNNINRASWICWNIVFEFQSYPNDNRNI